MMDCDPDFQDMLDVEHILRIAARQLERRDDVFEVDKDLILNHLGISKRCSLSLLRSFNHVAKTVSTRLYSDYLRLSKDKFSVDERFDETLQNTHISIPEPLSALHWVSLLTNMVWVELGLPSTPPCEWKVLDLVTWARLCEYSFYRLDTVVDHPQCEMILRGIATQTYSPRLLHPMLIFDQLFALCHKSTSWTLSAFTAQPPYHSGGTRHRTPERRVSNRFEQQNRPSGAAGPAPLDHSPPNSSNTVIPPESLKRLHMEAKTRKKQNHSRTAPQVSPPKNTSRSDRLVQDEFEREQRALEQRKGANKPFQLLPPPSALSASVNPANGFNARPGNLLRTSGDRIPPNSGQTMEVRLSTAVSFSPPNSLWESDQPIVFNAVNTIPRRIEASPTHKPTQLSDGFAPSNGATSLQHTPAPNHRLIPRVIEEEEAKEDYDSRESDEDYRTDGASVSSECGDADVYQDISTSADQSWSELEPTDPYPMLNLNALCNSHLGTIRAESAISSELWALQDSQPSQESQKGDENSYDSFGFPPSSSNLSSTPSCNTVIPSNVPHNNGSTASRIPVETSTSTTTSTRSQSRSRELIGEYEGPPQSSQRQGKRMKLKSPERENSVGAPLRHEFSDGGSLFPTEEAINKPVDGTEALNKASNNKKRQNQVLSSSAWPHGQFAYPKED